MSEKKKKQILMTLDEDTVAFLDETGNRSGYIRELIAHRRDQLEGARRLLAADGYTDEMIAELVRNPDTRTRMLGTKPVLLRAIGTILRECEMSEGARERWG